MRATLLSALFLAPGALAMSTATADDKKGKDAAADDLKRLAGEWKVVALESNGKKAPAAALDGMRWTFAGAEVRFADPGEEVAGKSSVALDPSKAPKHIDLVGLEGPVKGRTARGIYELKGDRLAVCLGDANGRPDGFATAKGSGLGMITLERVKDKK